MSFDTLIQGVLRTLSDPLGVAFIVGALFFLYLLLVLIRESGPRGPDVV